MFLLQPGHSVSNCEGASTTDDTSRFPSFPRFPATITRPHPAARHTPAAPKMKSVAIFLLVVLLAVSVSEAKEKEGCKKYTKDNCNPNAQMCCEQGYNCNNGKCERQGNQGVTTLPGTAPQNPSTLPGTAPQNPSTLPGTAPQNPSTLPGTAPQKPSTLPGSAATAQPRSSG